MAFPQKIEHRITLQFNNSTFRYIPKGTESRDSNRRLYISVQSSIIHKKQEVEATKNSIPKWMDKQNVVYTYDGLFSFKKDGKPWINLGDIMLSEMTVMKGQILYDSTYRRY